MGAFKKVGWMLEARSKHEYHGDNCRSHTLVGATVIGAFKKVGWMLEAKSKHEYHGDNCRSHTLVGAPVTGAPVMGAFKKV